MINKILMGIFKIIVNLIGLLLTPINNAISQYLPGLDSALTGIANALQIGGQYIGWVIDALCITPTTISLLVSVMVFKLTFPLVVSLFKLVVNWYDKMKV